jgi:phosphatidylglycerophosphate synthase
MNNSNASINIDSSTNQVNEIYKPTFGNKLPSEYDDPIDLYFKKLIDVINPYFKKWGFTPNMITTLSFILGLLSCYLYYKQKYILSSFLLILSYFFDVMDGYFARIYDMKSKFGSYYDSVSDMFVGIIMVYLWITNKNIVEVKYINIKYFIIIGFLLHLLSIFHLSCQEKYTKEYNNQYLSEGLEIIKFIPCKIEFMKYTRYFGTGLLYIFCSLCIFSHIFFKS